MDQDSIEQYCQNKDGEAWALAKSKDNTAYLVHESQLGLSQQSSAKDPFAFNTLPPQVQQGGFDFGSPGQRYPMFGHDQGAMFGSRRTSPFAFGNFNILLDFYFTSNGLFTIGFRKKMLLFKVVIEILSNLQVS